MKKAVMMAAALVLGTASVAKADGFVCTSYDGVLTARAFNNTDPSEGTRTPSILVLSDNTISHGRKTIASFRDAKSTLSGGSFRYVGRVDLRVSESNRAGEYIGGTRLGELASITLDVEHDYASAPMAKGELTHGRLILKKRSGGISTIPMDCERYLKGE